MMNKNLIIEWNMLLLNSLKIEYIMFFDWMSLIFFSTVLLISSMVMIYSMSYMQNDLNIKRFMFLILIFVLSMLFMIISPNLISILIGWDGLGLSSYCLVAYYSSKKSFNSSMITILMNRIGDIMIIISITLFMKFGSWNFLFLKKMNLILIIMIMMASITKSAQIPFSSWLPMAMAAPTPVSSLVHSSTLVTAGVYLLIRFNYLMNKNFLYLLMILSCMTMFMAGLSANYEFDMKKIIALSTLSQLGLMIMTISLNLPKLSFFHLINHAMFKSLLFLCSGIIIHNYFNNQDLRFISLMNYNMPMINLIFNIASLTLCGMPFLTGFYSKDIIIEMILMKNNNLFIITLMYLSMGMTISYTFRLMFYISIKPLKLNIFNFYISKNLMNYSILILLMMSILYGSMMNWMIFSSLNKIFLQIKMKMFIYYILTLGLFMGLIMPLTKKLFINKKMIFFMKFTNYMWFLNLMMKKNKKNIFKMNENIFFFIESTWLENNTKLPITYIYKMFNYKKIFKLNFILIMYLIMYFMLNNLF
uniref:NADH-ubiquinone oxidoreductase chain 5 n=1 Tax=Triraphis sp. QL-2013 TaxID=1421602 RepID=A0A0A6ZL19_9HYME|nr:NADH dehydrogenase subunit 5 [Triraphis sp. QL-2013]